MGNQRYAVLVGCNYFGTARELYGCINDVLAINKVLMSRFGFEPSNIKILTDKSGSAVMPTGANIKNALGNMIDRAVPGDVLYFHYSGHGTRISSESSDSMIEAIVPCDYNVITDVDFRELVNKLPEGTSFTFVSDSCHSGGLIDKEKEQIGPNTRTVGQTSISIKPRMIEFQLVLEQLSASTGLPTSDLAEQFQQQFGADASLMFRSSDPHVLEKVNPDNGILLSGCQPDENSSDVVGEDGKAYGAFSNAIEVILNGHPSPIINRELVSQARKLLREQGFNQQHPCLYCSDKNADAEFLLQ